MTWVLSQDMQSDHGGEAPGGDGWWAELGSADGIALSQVWSVGGDFGDCDWRKGLAADRQVGFLSPASFWNWPAGSG